MYLNLLKNLRKWNDILYFDALNDLRNIKQSGKVVQDIGKHAQGTIAYTISPIHTLDNWIG